MSIAPSEKACLSVSRRRLCPKERDHLLSVAVRMHRLEFCWIDRKSEFLPSAKQKLTDEFQAEELQRRDQQLLHWTAIAAKIGIT